MFPRAAGDDDDDDVLRLLGDPQRPPVDVLDAVAAPDAQNVRVALTDLLEWYAGKAIARAIVASISSALLLLSMMFAGAAPPKAVMVLDDPPDQLQRFHHDVTPLYRRASNCAGVGSRSPLNSKVFPEGSVKNMMACS
jgi:hypothetical protein